MRFKAAVFDIDGTILDSMTVWRNIASRYLAGRGITPEEDLEEKIAPMHLAQGSAYLKERYLLPESAEEISEAVLSMGRRAYETEVTLKRGAHEFLQMLSDRGIPMCLATSGSADLSGEALERLGVRPLFRGLLSCDDTGCGKADAGIYLRATELLGQAPHETAVFEDSLYALSAAAAAGFITVGIEDTDNIKDREEIRNTADFYLSSFDASVDPAVYLLVDSGS